MQAPRKELLGVILYFQLSQQLAVAVAVVVGQKQVLVGVQAAAERWAVALLGREHLGKVLRVETVQVRPQQVEEAGLVLLVAMVLEPTGALAVLVLLLLTLVLVLLMLVAVVVVATGLAALAVLGEAVLVAMAALLEPLERQIQAGVVAVVVVLVQMVLLVVPVLSLFVTVGHKEALAAQ